jgi:ribosomal protein S12 methylthiotransferase
LVSDTDVAWLRLFYMYPSGISREIVELMAREDVVLPYLDMPLQHGSDRMLEAMRRPERQAVIRERVAWIREAVPDVTLRTTVIVGFPGESEEDFSDMLDFLEELRFDRVGAFTYSVEDGTAAADMPDQIPDSLKRERLEQLMDVQRMISSERNEALIGRVFRALVDEVSDDPRPFGAEADGRPIGVARTVGQALDVDGVTHVYPFDGLAPGQFVTLEVEEAEEYDLIARVVEGA